MKTKSRHTVKERLKRYGLEAELKRRGYKPNTAHYELTKRNLKKKYPVGLFEHYRSVRKIRKKSNLTHIQARKLAGKGYTKTPVRWLRGVKGYRLYIEATLTNPEGDTVYNEQGHSLLSTQRDPVYHLKQAIENLEKTVTENGRYEWKIVEITLIRWEEAQPGLAKDPGEVEDTPVPHLKNTQKKKWEQMKWE